MPLQRSPATSATPLPKRRPAWRRGRGAWCRPSTQLYGPHFETRPRQRWPTITRGGIRIDHRQHTVSLREGGRLVAAAVRKAIVSKRQPTRRGQKRLASDAWPGASLNDPTTPSPLFTSARSAVGCEHLGTAASRSGSVTVMNRPPLLRPCSAATTWGRRRTAARSTRRREPLSERFSSSGPLRRGSARLAGLWKRSVPGVPARG